VVFPECDEVRETILSFSTGRIPAQTGHISSVCRTAPEPQTSGSLAYCGCITFPQTEGGPRSRPPFLFRRKTLRLVCLYVHDFLAGLLFRHVFFPIGVPHSQPFLWNSGHFRSGTITSSKWCPQNGPPCTCAMVPRMLVKRRPPRKVGFFRALPLPRHLACKNLCFATTYQSWTVPFAFRRLPSQQPNCMSLNWLAVVFPSDSKAPPRALRLFFFNRSRFQEAPPPKESPPPLWCC